MTAGGRTGTGRGANALGAAFVLSIAAVVYAWGWRNFWFLTDDAYIAFRYVGNRQLGYGYVWNAPPFLPVEGYTSFLWVLLLDLTWSLTGVEPPVAANWLAGAFGVGTLGLTAWMLSRMALKPALSGYRLWFLAVVLSGLVTNPTFLTWSSSGLETSLFNFLFLAWAAACLYGALGSPGWIFRVSLTSGLLALTRTDGLLVVMASVALLLATRLRATPPPPIRNLRSAWPLLLPAAHGLWRKSFYGEWLPNSFIAKGMTPWPEAGMRHALAYVLEYALWLWGLLALAAAVQALRSWQRSGAAPRLRLPAATTLPALVVATTFALHVAFYTFFAGGDPFEYRVYSPTIPLVLLSCVWMVNRLAPTGGVGRLAALGIPLLVIALSWPIPWRLHERAAAASTPERTANLWIPLAKGFPAGTRWYVQRFDELQRWLIRDHAVGRRRREHEVFHALRSALLPRERQLEAEWHDENRVLADGSVGVAGWILARAYLIDEAGANDWVIARSSAPHDTTPGSAAARRFHARQPPEGYVECFRPNLQIGKRASRFTPGFEWRKPMRRLTVDELAELREETVTIERRKTPLTSQEIQACDRSWRRQIVRSDG